MTPTPPIPVPPDRWAAHAETLARPWDRDAVLVDLGWWQSQGRVPGRRRAAQRWGWPERAVREVLRDRRAWLDRRAPAPALSPRPGRERRFDRVARPRVTHLHLGPEEVEEVRTILRGNRDHKRLVLRGADPEDVAQEVLLRLVVGEDGRRVTYDPERGSVGAYLQTRTRSILAHMASESRTMKRTLVTTGIVQVEDGGARVVDASTAAVSDPTQRPSWGPVLDQLAEAMHAGRPLADVRRLLSRLGAEYGR